MLNLDICHPNQFRLFGLYRPDKMHYKPIDFGYITRTHFESMQVKVDTELDRNSSYSFKKT